MRVDAFSLHTFRMRFPYGSSHVFFATYFASEMSCSLGRYEISFWVSEMSWFFGPDEISRDFRMSVHAL